MPRGINHGHKRFVLAAKLRLRAPSAEGDCLLDRGADIRHLKVEMHLLLLAGRLLRPNRRNVVLLLNEEKDKPAFARER